MKKRKKLLVSDSITRFVAQYPAIQGLPVGVEEDHLGDRKVYVYADSKDRTKGLPEKWEGDQVVVRVVGKVRPL